MALSRSIYNVLFKRNPVFVATTFVGGFAFMIGFDQLTTTWWDKHNYPKQWKDLRSKYIAEDQAAGLGDDDE